MSSNKKPIKKTKIPRETIKGFDAERFAAPFVLRCGALIIDYMIILLIPVASLLLGRFFQYDGAKLLNGVVMNTGWLITILLALTNLFIFPMFSGQTIGKMLTGIRIVNNDGSSPGFGAILLRHLLGFPITLFTGMIGFLFSAFTKEGKALHDYIAGTVVVYGNQKKRSTTVVKKEARTKLSRKASVAG